MTRVNIIGWIAKRLKALVGIVEDTDTATHAIAKGKYVIWKGSLRKTSAAISVGDALSSSNLSELSEGIGNELNSNIVNNRFKIVANGNIVIGRAYLLLMSESTIANKTFTVLYDPTDNNGEQHFGTVLDNGTNLFLCSADLSFSNGTISVTNAKRINSNGSGRDDWSVSIRLIRLII